MAYEVYHNPPSHISCVLNLAKAWQPKTIQEARSFDKENTIALAAFYRTEYRLISNQAFMRP